MPGVSYSREVEFTLHGPVVLHVIEAPKPGGLYSFAPVLSNELIVGRERVTEMERRVSSTATVAGVDGDLFTAEGHPSGILIRNGVLDRVPTRDRTSVGIGADGNLRIERVDYAGYYRKRTAARDFAQLARRRERRRALHADVGRGNSGRAVVRGRPAPVPDRATEHRPRRHGRLGRLDERLDADPARRRGAAGARNRSAEARGRGRRGSEVTTRVQLTPSWDGIATRSAGAGGRRGGKPVFRADEAFPRPRC